MSRQQSKSKIPMATTWVYDTNKYDILGIATSITVHAVSAFRGFGAHLGALFGGKSNLLEKVFLDAREEAYAYLSEKARKQGADLIVGVTIEVQEMHQFFIFTASGTMLKKRKNNGLPAKN